MKYIGIVVAMEEERQAIENLMKETEKEQIYNLVFTKGKIEKQDCILVESGVGKVNAARTLLQHHSPKASVLRHSAFFTVQLLHPYMTTGKTIALTRQNFVGKVMSLLLNTCTVHLAYHALIM